MSQVPESQTMDQRIGARLRAFRMTLGLRQVDFAERIGKDRSTISKYERGERQLALADMLDMAECLQYPPLALLLKLLPSEAMPPGLDEIVVRLMREPALVEAVRLGIQTASLPDSAR